MMRGYDDDIIEVIISDSSNEFDITDDGLIALYETSLNKLANLDQCEFVTGYYKSMKLDMDILRKNFLAKKNSIGIRANPILIKILNEHPEYSLHKFTIKRFRIPHDILTDEDYKLYVVQDKSLNTETLCIDCPEVPEINLDPDLSVSIESGLSCTEF